MLKTWNILPERFKLNYYYNNIVTLKHTTTTANQTI